MGAINSSQLISAARAGIADGLTKVAVLAQSEIVPLTPRRDGDLRDSIEVEPATTDDLQSRVLTDSEYAVAQHEHLEYHHSDGQAKYAEAGVQAMQAQIPAILATAVKQALGG